MNEIESPDNGEQLPSKSRQRLPLVLPSTSDSSPKLEEIKEKQSILILDKNHSDKVLQSQQQSKHNLSQAGSLKIQQHSSKVSAEQLTQLLTSACENENLSFEDIKYCKRHSIAYSPSLSNKSNPNNNYSSITNLNNNGNVVKTYDISGEQEIDTSALGFKKVILTKIIEPNRIQNKQIGSKSNQQQNDSNSNAHIKNCKNHSSNNNNTIMSLTGHQDESENSSDDQSSDCESSESSSEEYIQECSKKQLGLIKNESSESTNVSNNNQPLSSSCSSQQMQMSSQQQASQQQSQQYPLQFICVEMNCSETSKYCCVKCLSQGGHENHQAICFKTINSQIKSQLKMNKLSQVKLKIDQLFDNLSEKVNQCRETMNAQFSTAYSHLQDEAEYALNPNASLEKKVQIWKAYYQSEHAILMEHLSFILEKSDSFFNQIGSRIVNLNPKQILHIKQHTKYDVLFQKQIQSIQDELHKAEQNLSSRSKQALAALPQFNFQNDEFENSNSVSIQKFEYPERIEFCQVDKKGEQNGRCLIFWRDGAYRVGYHRGGQSQGICRMIWENGNVYEGSYVDDRKQGQGFFIKYADNTSYFGSFEYDAKNGYGIEYYRNNTHYVGEFKNWKLHGSGQLIDTITKKVIQEGRWKNSKFIGNISDL